MVCDTGSVGAGGGGFGRAVFKLKLHFEMHASDLNQKFNVIQLGVTVKLSGSYATVRMRFLEVARLLKESLVLDCKVMASNNDLG